MRYFLIILFFSLAWACDPPEYDEVPEIKFVSMTPQEVDQPAPGGIYDSVSIIVSFQDGDGDVGYVGDVNNDKKYLVDTVTSCIIGETGEGIAGKYDTVAANFFMKDSRTGCIIGYNIPDLEPKSRQKAISGELELIAIASFCRFLIPQLEVDTVIYSIYIEDRAGNNSNVVQTPPLYINCN